LKSNTLKKGERKTYLSLTGVWIVLLYGELKVQNSFLKAGERIFLEPSQVYELLALKGSLWLELPNWTIDRTFRS